MRTKEFVITAQYESMTASDRVIAGMKAKIKRENWKPGRKPGAKNKKGVPLDEYRDEIIHLVDLGLSIKAIQKYINGNFFAEKKLQYSSFHRYVYTDSLLHGMYKKHVKEEQ